MPTPPVGMLFPSFGLPPTLSSQLRVPTLSSDIFVFSSSCASLQTGLSFHLNLEGSAGVPRQPDSAGSGPDALRAHGLIVFTFFKKFLPASFSSVPPLKAHHSSTLQDSEYTKHLYWNFPNLKHCFKISQNLQITTMNFF